MFMYIYIHIYIYIYLCVYANIYIYIYIYIYFSVLCNDDCYRASLALHTDAASLSDIVTLLQSMCLCA